MEIPNDCLILMNDEGIPLTKDESLLQLLKLLREEEEQAAGSRLSERGGERGLEERGDHKERRLYVFDREHLDADPEIVADTLRIDEEMVLNEPPLNRM